MDDELEYYVLHSAYRDASWRGIEKCVTSEQGEGPRLFHTVEDAKRFAVLNGIVEYFRVVKVKLVFPELRQSLSLDCGNTNVS